jgi:hypothetical protein
MANGGTTHVTSQMVTTQLVGGRFVKGVEVSFVTPKGNNGSVFVSDDTYSPDAVKAAIAAKAATMDAVSDLRV